MVTASKNGAAAVVEVPRIEIQRMSITVVGDSPLISHRWSDKAKKMMLDKQQKKATQAKEAKDPWMDFCESLYWLTERPDRATEDDLARARFGMPSVCFKASAVAACRDVDGMTMTESRGRFHVEGEMIEITGSVPQIREDMVRIGMGTADIRYRGEFPTWRASLPIAYNARAISAEQIVNLFNIAGFGVGVGEWRPSQSGSYGRFHVATEDE
jgi:hypothetical protein